MESIFRIDWELVEKITKNIRVDKRLDKYEKLVRCPESLERANRLLKGVKLPDGRYFGEE